MIDRCSASLTAGSKSSSNKQCAKTQRGQLLNFAYKAPADSPKTGTTNNIGNTCDGMAMNHELLPIFMAHKNASSASQMIAMTMDKERFLVHWRDTYMYEKHIALHEKDGYKTKKHTRCLTAAKLHGPIGRLQIRKVEWEPSWEPSDIGIPQDMIDALYEAKNAADCIDFARDNCRRLDQDKSNTERQGHWPPLKSNSTSVLLHDPTLTMLIDINPMDTINPDQDIAPTLKHVISNMHGNMPPAGKPLANVYAPSGKLCGTITFERLQILYHAFTLSQQNQPEIHQQHHNPTFEHALARLLSRNSNKHTLKSKTTKIKNHWATPDEYMKAIVDGLSITTERFASPLNFDVASDSYCSMYLNRAITRALLHMLSKLHGKRKTVHLCIVSVSHHTGSTAAGDGDRAAGAGDPSDAGGDLAAGDAGDGDRPGSGDLPAGECDVIPAGTGLATGDVPFEPQAPAAPTGVAEVMLDGDSAGDMVAALQAAVSC